MGDSGGDDEFHDAIDTELMPVRVRVQVCEWVIDVKMKRIEINVKSRLHPRDVTSAIAVLCM